MENKKLKNKKFNHETIDIGYKDLDCITAKSGRTYSTPDGVQYPSITTVLSILSEAVSYTHLTLPTTMLV